MRMRERGSGRVVGNSYLEITSRLPVIRQRTTAIASGTSYSYPLLIGKLNGPKVVLPANVRKMLRQRMAHRYHLPGLGASPQD
jgi:hypothetical protein